MDTGELLFPEIDFAWHEMPNLHTVLEEARLHGPVVTVRYHDKPAYLVLSHAAVSDGLSDEETFPSPAFYTQWAQPTMGRTLQCMSGAEHRRARNLVNAAFRAVAIFRSARPRSGFARQARNAWRFDAARHVASGCPVDHRSIVGNQPGRGQRRDRHGQRSVSRCSAWPDSRFNSSFQRL